MQGFKESLKKLGLQLAKIWQDLGINQRIIVAASGMAVFAALMSVGVWSTKPSYELLYGRLSLTEAEKVVTYLEDNKIEYQLGQSGTSISVPRQHTHRVRMTLASQGIPKKSDKVGLEIFDKPAFGLSNMQQRVNYMRAVQGELAETISQMDGIESAEVMVVIPEHRLLIENQVESSASVWLKTGSLERVTPEQVRAIQFLVATSVEGLTPQRVSVTNSQGELLSREEGTDSIAFLSDQRLEAQRTLEAYLTHKAEEMLNRVLGPGQAIVQVAAELNYDTKTSTSIKYDETGVPLSTTETSEKVETGTNDGTMVPGTVANTTTQTNLLSSAPEFNSTDKTVKDNQFAVGSTTNDIVQMAGGIAKLTAAVFVAKRMETNNTGVVYVPRDVMEIESIKRVVANSLGITNVTDHLTVEQFEFYQKAPDPVMAEMRREQQFQRYMDIAKQALYTLLGLGVLGLFAMSIRKAPQDGIPIGIPLEDYAKQGDRVPDGEGLEVLAGEGAESMSSNGNGHGNGQSGSDAEHETYGDQLEVSLFDDDKEVIPTDVTVEVLNRMIRENPNNLGKAINTWLNEDDSASA